MSLQEMFVALTRDQLLKSRYSAGKTPNCHLTILYHAGLLYQHVHHINKEHDAKL